MNWRLKHFVLSDFYISYQPLQAKGLRDGEAALPLQLTTSSAMLAGSEPAYIALLGRPAGFINWLLSRLGFLRRLEFVLTQRQAIYSLTSVSSFESHVSEIAGLNSIVVSIVRPVRQVVAWLVVALALFYARSQVSYGLATTAEAADVIDHARLLLLFLAIIPVAYAAYLFFAKRITMLAFSEGGQTTIAMGFVPSVVEGKSVDAKSLLQIPKIFHALKH